MKKLMVPLSRIFKVEKVRIMTRVVLEDTLALLHKDLLRVFIVGGEFATIVGDCARWRLVVVLYPFIGLRTIAVFPILL